MNVKTIPTRFLAVTLSLGLSQVFVPIAQAATPHMVDPSQVAASLIAKAQSRQAKIELFQKALAVPEVQQKAHSLGLDAARLSRAIPHLSDAQLADLTARATRAQDVVAGHRHHHRYGDETTLIVIGLALLLAAVIILAVAGDDEDDWDVVYD